MARRSERNVHGLGACARKGAVPHRRRPLQPAVRQGCQVSVAHEDERLAECDRRARYLRQRTYALMAYIVMAHIVMALRGYGPYSYGLYS